MPGLNALAIKICCSFGLGITPTTLVTSSNSCPWKPLRNILSQSICNTLWCGYVNISAIRMNLTLAKYVRLAI